MAKRSTSKQSNARSRGNIQGESSEQGGELHELFLEELADIYNAEQQLAKALPKMAKAAESEELRQAFELHLQETEQQIQRLEELAETLDESISRKTCQGMQGLIEEAQDVMKEFKNSAALDAALIASAQKVEHYEIASYGTLATWAEQMGHEEAVELLKQTLSEEEATDEKLTGIAESVANQRAEVE